MIEPIYNQIPREEFDYQTLLDVLKNYERPRDKISDFLRKGVIVRIKKGLYIFGEGYRKKPYSRELLANLIYGPSYISLDYALQYHALIPERVEAVTSVTTGRSRRFETPVGLFTYRKMSVQAFRFGMTRVELDGQSAFLIAIAEKALADKVQAVRGTGIKTLRQMREYLADDLRIDESSLKQLSPLHFDEIGRRYRSRKIRILSKLIRRLRKTAEGGAMNEAVARLLERYDNRSIEDYLKALREILQEIALLGLWRSKFFDKAAFYGGTALRILYGLDRFSEDMDFSLLSPMDDFELSAYTTALQKELAAFGFDVRIDQRDKSAESAIQSAFLKANTLNQLLVIETSEDLLKTVHRGQILKIKLEIDTDPPPEFETHTRYLLQPIPFAVRTYTLPDLFAGKMHAILCRRWKNRVKGRDWYDLVWYTANHPQLHLAHLEQRMRQSGDWKGRRQLIPESFKQLLSKAIDNLVVDQARKDAEAFIRDPKSLAIWSQEFFQDIADRIQPV